MKRLFIALLILSLAIPIASAADPYAGFIADSINGSAPLTISFVDASYDNPTSYMWNATDVITTNIPTTIGVSKNLTYTFNIAGNYSIQHIVSNSYGTNSTGANLTFVNVSGPAGIPVADFSVDDDNVPAGTIVHFTDLSTNVPTSWLWEYLLTGGDTGWVTFSTDQNPSLTAVYINPYHVGNADYDIRLTATNAAGSDTEIKYSFLAVTPAPESPIASFTPTGTLESGSYVIRVDTNTTVWFNDTSTAGAPTSWYWAFGSKTGTQYSSMQHPNFTYNATTAYPDIPYAVTLTASNAAGSDSETKYVIMSDPPITPIVRYDVTAVLTGFDVTHGTPDTQRISVYNGFDPGYDHTVLFDDKSYNSPTSLSWTIDAGNGSSYNYYVDNFNFDYGYAEPGNYSVIHSATNDAGTDTLTMLTLVNVLDTVPPASISGITNVTGTTQIKWNWTLPSDSDYSYAQVYKDGVFYANVTGNGTTWSGLTPSTLYTISTHAVDIYGNVNSTWVNLSSTTLGSTWEYTTCGANYWVAPEGAGYITLEMIAAGGSGHPGYNTGGIGGGYYYGGWGGKAGEAVTYPKVLVEPGTNYTLMVGCKGASATYGTDSNAGTYSSAFGTTVNGGLGGLPKVSGDTDPSDGGDGEDGLGTTPLAINGTTTALGTGGIAGLGRGASGGGSASNTTAAPLGTGGAGADGYINITVFGYASVNLPDFSADLTSSVPGTLIHFTDESTIANGAGLTYNWSFGDGYYSSVAGDTQHVYSYTGSYDVSLTLTSSDGTATEIKYAYINIVSEPDIINPPDPMVVNFHILYGWGTPLSDVNVTVVPISTSTGDWDWLATMFSLPTGEVQISNLSMSQTTDSFGVASFLMTSTVKYNISFTKAGYTIAPLLLVPTTSDYTQYATETGVGDPTYVHGVNELQAVSIVVSQIEVNDSYSYLNMTYSDSTGHTTGGYIDVVQKSSIPRDPSTTIVRWYVTSNSESNSTLVAHPQQVDGSVQAHINNDFNTTRTYPFSMKGAPVNFMGFGAEIRLLVALGIMLLTVMLAGAATGRPIVVVMAVEGWIFYTTGFFQALIDRGTPDASIILSLVLVTVIAIAANIPYRRK